MADKSLLLLLDEVRQKTIRILKSVPAESTRWAPPGLQNTILWHAGHAFVLVEWLTMTSLDREPQIPDGWFEMFSWESRPARVPSNRWPALSLVIQQLEAQWTRLQELVKELDDNRLDAASADNPKRTVRSAIIHGLHDEACHSGEIYLLAKMKAVKKG
jgi:hypothetical protein